MTLSDRLAVKRGCSCARTIRGSHMPRCRVYRQAAPEPSGVTSDDVRELAYAMLTMILIYAAFGMVLLFAWAVQ